MQRGPFGARPALMRCSRRLLGLCGFLAALRGLRAELLREPLDPSLCIDQLLPTGEERMAVGADLEVKLRFRRAGLPRRPARAAYFDLVVFRMDAFSHSELLRSSGKRPL